MNIHQIYVEKEIFSDPKVQKIINRFPLIPVVKIEQYQEIFNRKKQNFRLQKETPCLILAKKFQNFIHPIPQQFGLGADYHFYFSYVINCPFDCSYCFLQGLNRSSHYVIFVNSHDFTETIRKECLKNPTKNYLFFSGYDSDSLALDGLSKFCYDFLPFFETLDNAKCEIRTKSIQIKPLLELNTTKNTIVAYTLNPTEIIHRDEKKTPSLEKRIEAIQKLQSAGYKIGLRFDPIMWIDDAFNIYDKFFKTVLKEINISSLHSVTIGSYRLPKQIFQNFVKISPFDSRLALLEESNNQEYSYPLNIVEKLLQHSYNTIANFIPTNKIFLMQ